MSPLKKLLKQFPDSIYSAGDHLKFNEVVRELVRKSPSIKSPHHTYSRPGKTQHNIKLSGTWPEVKECSMLYKALKSVYPRHTITLSFNGSPYARRDGYRFYCGLVVGISLYKLDDTKDQVYVCPWSRFVSPEVQAVRDEYAAKAKASLESEAKVDLTAGITVIKSSSDEDKVLELYRAAKKSVQDMVSLHELAGDTKFSKLLVNDMQIEINKLKAPWSAVGINL